MNDRHRDIATGILILTTWTGCISAFIVVRERTDYDTRQIAVLQTEKTSLELRVRALENDRGLEREIAALRTEIVALKTAWQTAEAAERKRRRGN